MRPAAASIIPSIPSFFIFSNLVPTFPLIGTIFKSLLIFLNCAALLILLVPIIAPFLKFFKEIPSLDTKTSLTSSLSALLLIQNLLLIHMVHPSLNEQPLALFLPIKQILFL